MSNFIFYKKRNFNALVNDTLSFFRMYAKNFFVNYLIINGALLLAIAVIATFMTILIGEKMAVTGDFFGAFSSVMLVFLVIVIMLVVLSLFVQCFPIAYAQILEKRSNETEITAKELFEIIKGMIARMFLFGFISAFVLGIPYMILITILNFIPIIGTLGSIFLNILFTLYVTQAMLLYVKDKMGYFAALNKVGEQLKINFWDKWGATAIMNLITGLFMFAGLIIPIVIFFVFIGVTGFESSDYGIGTGLLFFILFILVIIVAFVTMNLQSFLQILIYFSEKEGEQTDDIDLIGQNVED
ncbi:MULTISPECIES: hypothetical protein [unclassified Capnocytophaga]|jgi:hypothetical protein|uniref:hypothetical protein n=1 Tax=unclassified Capnocytophaga TaxID=2640652 RepID=UPI000202DBEF|nr:MULTISPECIES: hypothetical protein [unclassified Capnocytophaga]EGD33388.1 YjbE family integral membrane protein [Capnocytophaga sp. oral taxon 338 str. F0234]MEB3004089.1 hypothetical protein [Capnocytophaga sp. G2]